MLKPIAPAAAGLALVVSLPAQESLAAFHAPSVVLPVDSPPFQRLLDVDGDGDLDAIGSRVRSDGVRLEIVAWRNDAGVYQQAWQQQVSISSVTGANNLQCVVGDFDGDGLQDAVFAGAANILQLLSRPGFTFAVSAQPVAFNEFVNGIAAARLDGDNRDDLAVVLEGPWRGLEVRLSTGPVLAILMPLFALGGPYVMQADADAQPEIGVTISANQMMPFDLAGNVLTPLPMLTTTPSPSNVHLWMSGDVDGDSDVDLVVFKPPASSNQPGTYQVFRHNGTALVPQPEASGGPAEYLADIDGDGDLDGVCCGGGGGPTTPTWPQLNFASTFELALNDGTGAFALAWAIPGNGSRSMAGAADVDGDGDVDLVAGRCVFYGRGPWRQHPMPSTRLNLFILRRWSLNDADRDGDLDVSTSPWGGIYGLGDGSFVVRNLPGVTPPAGRSLGGGTPVDYDGDGADDYVAPQYTTSPLAFEYMALLRNNGGGHFTYAGPVTAPGVRIGFGVTVDHFFVADLDGDGDQDIVANSRPDFDGYSSQIFWRQGAVYVAGPAYPTERVEGVADFDGDGRSDLLRSNSFNYLVALGTGNPSTPFAAPQAIALRSSAFVPMANLVRDLNDDGRPDLVMPSTGSLNAYFNTSTSPGSVAFAAQGLTPANWVEAGDFNGDGRCDLLLTELNAEPNVALLMLRANNNPLPGPADYVQVRQVLGSGICGDMDGDGDLDYVGASAVQNARFFGAAGGQRTQYGSAIAGEAGAAPVLGARGILRPGNVVELALTGVPGPTIAAIDLSFAPASLPNTPIPGLTLLIDPTNFLTITVSIAASGEGVAAASLALPIALNQGFAGSVFYLQSFVLDLASPTILTQTTGLRLQVGS